MPIHYDTIEDGQTPHLLFSTVVQPAPRQEEECPSTEKLAKTLGGKIRLRIGNKLKNRSKLGKNVEEIRKERDKLGKKGKNQEGLAILLYQDLAIFSR